MSNQLEERKATALARHDVLKREIGAAMVESGELRKDLHAELVSLQYEISALEDANAEATRRQREEFARDKSGRDAELRLQIKANEAKRLDAIEAANAAAVALVESFRTALEMTSQIRTDIDAIGGPVPLEYVTRWASDRYSSYLSTLLITIQGQRLGYIECRLTPHCTPSDKWRDLETRLGANTLDRFINSTEDTKQ